MNSPLSYSAKGNYIGGGFHLPQEKIGEIEKKDPGDLSQTVGVFPYDYTSVESAVLAARQAYPRWSRLAVKERMAYLDKFKLVLLGEREKFAHVISHETGKPLWEAEGEVSSMIQKVQITFEDSLKFIAPFEMEIAPGLQGKCRYKPRGVFAVLGPFNFPGHLPNGHIIPALLTGNCVVFKPSELTPLTGQLMAEVFDKSGLPAGVLNLVQGDGEVGRRLVGHTSVDGVLFTGSFETGLKIKQETLQHYWKILALEMGGKNAAIVLKDAPLEKSLYETLTGGYLTAGQRCSSTSRLILEKSIAEKFLQRFVTAAEKLKIGYAFDTQDPPFMGPLISRSAVEKYLTYVDMGIREGGEALLAAHEISGSRQGYYVSPSLTSVSTHKKDSLYERSEIFGPHVSVYIVSDLDEALAIANDSPFGLVLSIFTKWKKNYDKAFAMGEAGVINWNRSTVGASSKLPFGGLKKSGNCFPTALFAPFYCTYPVASLEDSSETLDKNKIIPGVSF